MRRLAVVALVTASTIGVAGAAPTLNPVDHARAVFERGEYRQVVATLTPELSRIREEAALKEAHYLLAVAYFFLRDRELARQEFSALLYLDPKYELDAATESPEVYAFYEALKRELHDKLDEIRRQKERDEAAKRLPARELVIERTYHPRAGWSYLIPFGYGQFRNGHTTKGIILLAVESMSAAASISLFAQQAVTYGIPSRYPATLSDADRQALRTRQVIQVASGAVFLVTYIVGVIDAYANQPPPMTETQTERPYKPPVKPATPSSRLMIVPGPITTPDSFGLQALWRF